MHGKKLVKKIAFLITGLFLISCNSINNDNEGKKLPIPVSGKVDLLKARVVFVGRSPRGATTLETQPTFENTSILAVKASGEVIASSPISSTGDFKFDVDPEKASAVGLVLASKGSSGKWVCQSALQYGTGAQVKPVAFDLTSAKSIDAGQFAFSGDNGLAVATPSSATTGLLSNAAAFEDQSLSGYQRCGNDAVLESAVKLDYNFSTQAADIAYSNDDANFVRNGIVFGFDAQGRWIGAASIAKSGQVGATSLRIRQESGSSVNVVPWLVDTREPALGVLRMPTWNADLAPVAVTAGQDRDLGAISSEVAVLKGSVTDKQQQASSGAAVTVNLSGEQTANRKAINSAVTNGQGDYSVLVLQPKTFAGTWGVQAKLVGGSSASGALDLKLFDCDPEKPDPKNSNCAIIIPGTFNGGTLTATNVVSNP